MNLDWDPEIDTPATIAIVGGGPIGVEAALYARFLGYFVMLFDAAKVGHRMMRWGDHLMPAPWSTVTSPLGLAALDAQGNSGLPAANEVVSYRRYVEEYLLPVARTDLLYDFVNINSRVTSISRTGCAINSPIPAARRAEQEFRLLIHSTQRGEYTQLADIVLDCSGREKRVGLASGSGLAVGELSGEAESLCGKVDVLGKSRQLLSGKHALMIGSDLAACVNALDFAQLIRESESETRLTWILPKKIGKTGTLDVTDVGIAERAQALCTGSQSGVVTIPAWGIESLQFLAPGWQVRLQTEEDESLDLQADVLVNCVPSSADWTFLNGLSATNNLAMAPCTPEPHYYVLGSKSSSAEAFDFEQAFAQIRQTFALIGGRENLDLYTLIKSQLEKG